MQVTVTRGLIIVSVPITLELRQKKKSIFMLEVRKFSLLLYAIQECFESPTNTKSVPHGSPPTQLFHMIGCVTGRNVAENRTTNSFDLWREDGSIIKELVLDVNPYYFF